MTAEQLLDEVRALAPSVAWHVFIDAPAVTSNGITYGNFSVRFITADGHTVGVSWLEHHGYNVFVLSQRQPDGSDPLNKLADKHSGYVATAEEAVKLLPKLLLYRVQMAERAFLTARTAYEGITELQTVLRGFE